MADPRAAHRPAEARDRDGREDTLRFLNELEDSRSPRRSSSARASCSSSHRRRTRCTFPTSTRRSTSKLQRRTFGTPSSSSARGGPSFRPIETPQRDVGRAGGLARVLLRVAGQALGRLEVVGHRLRRVRAHADDARDRLLRAAVPAVAGDRRRGRRVSRPRHRPVLRRAPHARRLREARRDDRHRVLVPRLFRDRGLGGDRRADRALGGRLLGVARADERHRPSPPAHVLAALVLVPGFPTGTTARGSGCPILLFFAVYSGRGRAASACACDSRGSASRCRSGSRSCSASRSTSSGLPALPFLSVSASSWRTADLAVA